MTVGYELYRVITDYEALQDGFLDRIEDLNTSLEQIDMAGGLAKGNAQKLLSKNPGKMRKDRPNTVSRRTFGWESLGKMLKGTGLALVLVVDDERFEPIKEQLVGRRRIRMPAIAGITRTPWLLKGEKAREMGKKRFSMMSEAKRKKHQQMAAKARWRKRRKDRAREALAVASKTTSQRARPAFDSSIAPVLAPVDMG